MRLPPLYKYLDARGAKLTLGNRRFKHSKPSDFNDTEDLTIQSIFPEETEIALKKIESHFRDVLFAHLNDPPTCASPLREKVALLQRVYRANPEVRKVVEAALAEEEGHTILDVEQARSRASAFVKEINEFMQDYRVLCVSTHKDSDRMWCRYAERHTGIALRIEPNVAKDSKFQLFRQVVYRSKRPSLYDGTLEFVEGSLFGDQLAQRRAMIEKILYSKTLDWQYESEYRLVIALGQGEAPWDTLPFHAEEVTELYLGSAMKETDKMESQPWRSCSIPTPQCSKQRAAAGVRLTLRRSRHRN